jgi:predicted nuclease of restriction endonuclease-like RecB superfamily
MLTGKMVRVRFARDRIVPYYLDVDDPNWREIADRLLDLFRGRLGCTRGELEEDRREAFGDDPGQLVHQGLAKLLEDRCDFEVVSGHPPADIRAAAFRVAALARGSDSELLHTFDRSAVLKQAADELGMSPAEADEGLFADLKSEQRLVRFQDISPERVLERYNVALAQAVLLRALRLVVTIRGESPQRYRQLLRRVKFHRLVCEMERVDEHTNRLHLDGPLSLFTATQKYGLQLALFLPYLLLCRDFEVKAEIRWSARGKAKTFLIRPQDGLVSHTADAGGYVAPELLMFAELFRKQVTGWELTDEPEVFPLPGGYWVPDFRLIHRESGQSVLLEVLGFWRRSSAEQHLSRLRTHVKMPFLLAVADQLHIDEAALDDMPAGIHRFRSMPLPDEIARLAESVLGEHRASEPAARPGTTA